MIELYKDKYVTFNYYPQYKTISEIWTPVTEDMTTEEMKALMLKLASFFQNYETRNYLSDAVNLNFGIGVDLQTWIDETIAPHAIKSGMNRTARVVSQDFITQLSYEQFVEEKNMSEFQNKFFDNFADAEDWLHNS